MAKSEKSKIDELNMKVEALGDAITEKDERIEAAEEKIKNFQPDQQITKKNPKVPSERFTVDKKAYRFNVVAFYFEGGKVMAQDALKDKKLLAALVDQQVGVIERA